MSQENEEFEKLNTLWSNRDLSVADLNDKKFNDISQEISKLEKLSKQTFIATTLAATSLFIPFSFLAITGASLWSISWIVLGMSFTVWQFLRHEGCRPKILDLEKSMPKYKLSEEKTKDLLNSLLRETISFNLTRRETELFKKMNNIEQYSQDFVDNLIKGVTNFNHKKKQEVLKKKTEQDLAVFFKSDNDAERVLIIQSPPNTHREQPKSA